MAGCGHFGRKRIEACRKAAEFVDLRAVLDINESLAAQVGAKYGVQLYTDSKALLANAEVEAVILALPNNLQGSLAVQALEAGKHLLCENPLAISPSEA